MSKFFHFMKLFWGDILRFLRLNCSISFFSNFSFYKYFLSCILPSARATMLASASKQCFIVLVRAAGLLLYLNLRVMEQSRSFFFVRKFAGSWIINQSIKLSFIDVSPNFINFLIKSQQCHKSH